MADTTRVVDYYYVEIADKPGEGTRVLNTLRGAGVNLLAFHAFPKGRRSQLDFVPSDGAQLKAAAKQARWKVTGPKKVFLIEGDDRIGAVAEILGRLADAKINVTAVDAVCAGPGRFGSLLWVKPRDVKKAAKALAVV